VGALVFPYHVPASAIGRQNRQPPSDRITLACIGLGGRGKENLRSFMRHETCRVVAVCDVNANRLEEAKKIVDDHYGSTDCATYGDCRAVLARGDIE